MNTPNTVDRSMSKVYYLLSSFEFLPEGVKLVSRLFNEEVKKLGKKAELTYHRDNYTFRIRHHGAALGSEATFLALLSIINNIIKENTPDSVLDQEQLFGNRLIQRLSCIKRGKSRLPEDEVETYPNSIRLHQHKRIWYCNGEELSLDHIVTDAIIAGLKQSVQPCQVAFEKDVNEQVVFLGSSEESAVDVVVQKLDIIKKYWYKIGDQIPTDVSHVLYDEGHCRGLTTFEPITSVMKMARTTLFDHIKYIGNGGDNTYQWLNSRYAVRICLYHDGRNSHKLEQPPRPRRLAITAENPSRSFIWGKHTYRGRGKPLQDRSANRLIDDYGTFGKPSEPQVSSHDKVEGWDAGATTDVTENHMNKPWDIEHRKSLLSATILPDQATSEQVGEWSIYPNGASALMNGGHQTPRNTGVFEDTPDGWKVPKARTVPLVPPGFEHIRPRAPRIPPGFEKLRFNQATAAFSAVTNSGVDHYLSEHARTIPVSRTLLETEIDEEFKGATPLIPRTAIEHPRIKAKGETEPESRVRYSTMRQGTGRTMRKGAKTTDTTLTKPDLLQYVRSDNYLLGPDPSAEFVKGLNAKLAAVLDRMRNYRGRCVVEAYLGRIIIDNVDVDQVATDLYSKHELPDEMVRYLETTTAGFTPILSQYPKDILTLIEQTDEDGKRVWLDDFPGHDRPASKVNYEILAASMQYGQTFTVELDADTFEAKVFRSESIAEINVHCMLRNWDIKIIAGGKQDLWDRYRGFVDEVMHSAYIESGKKDANLAFEYSESHKIHVISVRVHRTCLYSNVDASSTLNVTEVTRTNMDHFVAGQIFNNDSKSEAHAVDMTMNSVNEHEPLIVVVEATPITDLTAEPSGYPVTWYEMFITSTHMNHVFGDNTDVKLGDEATWKVDDFKGDDGFCAVWKPALLMVKNTEHTGFHNDNGLKAVEEETEAREKGGTSKNDNIQGAPITGENLKSMDLEKEDDMESASAADRTQDKVPATKFEAMFW